MWVCGIKTTIGELLLLKKKVISSFTVYFQSIFLKQIIIFVNTSGYNEEITAEVAKRGIEIQVKADAERACKKC